MKKKAVSGLIILIILILVVVGVTIYSFNREPAQIEFSISDEIAGLTEQANYNHKLSKQYKGEFIGAVYIEGVISQTNAQYDQHWLMSTIRKLKNNPRNTALAIFINSPGGAVYQADEVYLALMDYRTTGRPVYVYQGAMAASGGYYISCAGNQIYANRNTLTGCIGVIMGNSYDLTGLFEKLGIKSTTIHSGKNKNMMNYNEPFTEEQKAIMQSMCDECYEQFVSIVSNSRNLSYDKACELSDGRLYTAKQALNNDLIDKIDSWENMLRDLSEKLEKPGIKVTTYKKPKKNPTMLELLTGKAHEFATAKAAGTLGLPEKVIDDMNNSGLTPMYLAQ